MDARSRVLVGWLALVFCIGSHAQVCTTAQLQVDVRNCATCGHDCYADALHSVQACTAGSCQFQRCDAGYYDLNGDQLCEYACTFRASQEICNGLDDDCDGSVDEDLIAPSASQVCGVSPAANSAECTSNVAAACINGAWQCGFPAGVCSPTCADASEFCDGLDNNCNGQIEEKFSKFGKACASDDGVPGGHGRCRTTGTIQCATLTTAQCSAVKASCDDLAGGCTEFCDGIDNDCDGLVDENFAAKGSNSTNFVRPAVTQISATRWMYSYEASRPNAAITTQGNGNGYATSAPAAVTIEKTPSCSEPGQLPWTNLSAREAEQICAAAGGELCTTADYQAACQAGSACQWGYSPRGMACTTAALGGTKYCNLDGTYDFNTATAGDQDGLLTSGDPALKRCWGDWSGLQGNSVLDDKIYDLTGNVREFTKTAANDFRLMGGAYDHQSEAGATCTFTTFRVDQDFRLQDSGFRCCFGADPRL